MAGTFTTKLLASGQLPLATADLFVVPAATTAIVVLVKLVNTDAVARLVNLYVKPSGGTQRRVSAVNKSLTAGADADEPKTGEFTLGPGDAIRGDADAAAVVDFTIHGVLET